MRRGRRKSRLKSRGLKRTASKELRGSLTYNREQLLKHSPAAIPLSQSNCVLARYRIQVIDEEFDGPAECIVNIGYTAEEDDSSHKHPGPRAIEARPDRSRCDKDSLMQIFWSCCFPYLFLQNCVLDFCNCIADCLSVTLRTMEEHYTLRCCDYCCKIELK